MRGQSYLCSAILPGKIPVTMTYYYHVSCHYKWNALMIVVQQSQLSKNVLYHFVSSLGKTISKAELKDVQVAWDILVNAEWTQALHSTDALPMWAKRLALQAKAAKFILRISGSITRLDYKTSLVLTSGFSPTVSEILFDYTLMIYNSWHKKLLLFVIVMVS